MESLVVVCHNEAYLSFRVGLQSKLGVAYVHNGYSSLFFSLRLLYNSGEQQKVIDCDLDLQSLDAYAFFHNLPTLYLHTCYSGDKSILVLVPLEQCQVTWAADYAAPNKVKEPLRTLQWLGIFKEVGFDINEISGSVRGNYRKSIFFIKELNNVHTFGGGVINLSHPHVSKKLISSLIIAEIKDNPNKRTKDIRKQFLKEYGFEITRYFAYTSKKQLLNTTWGENEESFKFLNWYTQKLIETNLGSHVVLEVEPERNKFKRLFISFSACIRGINYCRPLIFMDATHLKSEYLGYLMASTGLNGDNGRHWLKTSFVFCFSFEEIYPLAYDVVSSENDANWKWFIEYLKQILNVKRKYTFVSDCGSGLVSQIHVVFEGAIHGWCFCHMKNNINACLSNAKKTYNKYILDMFGNCAYANTHKVFSENMLKLRQIKNQKLQDYFNRGPANKLASVYFLCCRGRELCLNVAESFNGWVREEREMPIAVMVDEI